jgi:hypothetical protein
MGQSLYTTETPSGETSESPGPTLGTVVTPGVAGNVTHLKWFAPAESTGNDAATPLVLYDAITRAELARVTISLTLNAWNVGALATPVAVSAGQAVIPSVKTASRYTFTGGYFNGFALVVGDLTAPATADDPIGNGRFATGIDGYPDGHFNGNNYWTDLVFEPTGSPTPDGFFIPASVGSPTASVGLSTAPSGIAKATSLGLPTAAYNLSTAPSGIGVAVALGTPSAAVQSASPAGIAVGVAPGTPAASYGLSAAPSGLAVVVRLGSPSSLEPVSSGSGQPRVVTVSTGRRITTSTRPGRITD